VTVAVNCCAPLAATVAGDGETVTTTMLGETTATVADADFVESACDTAVTVTVLGFGTFAGAVYSPLEEIVPTVEFPPAWLFTSHMTAVFDVPVTVTVNCCVSLGWRVALVGKIWTAIEPVPGPLTLWPTHPVSAALTLRSRMAPAFLMVPQTPKSRSFPGRADCRE
jgi:hypothetical protein